MKYYSIKESVMFDIAEAIRDKTGQTKEFTPSEMPIEIRNIVSGGSSDDVRYVTFMNGDQFLYRKPVATGDDCVDVEDKNIISTPTKESTVEYDYTFYGWGASDNGGVDEDILKTITANKTVYAIYTSTLRSYTITYMDDDGVTVLYSEPLLYGTVPSYVPKKTGFAFVGWTSPVESVTGDMTYIAVWEEAAGGSLSSTIDWTLANGVLTISGSGAMPDFTGASAQPWVSSVDLITSVVVEDGITKIGNNAFRSLSNAVTITVPNSVTSLGDYAFAYCTSMTSFIMPTQVTTIPQFAFYNCSGLKYFATGNTVTTIMGYAFSGCTGMTYILIGSAVTKIYPYALLNCTTMANNSLRFKSCSTWKYNTNGNQSSGTTIGTSVAFTNYGSYYALVLNYFNTYSLESKYLVKS